MAVDRCVMSNLSTIFNLSKNFAIPDTQLVRFKQYFRLKQDFTVENDRKSNDSVLMSMSLHACSKSS